MSPLFEPSDDGEHLGVMDLVILLYRIECFQEEHYRMPGMIFAQLLGEDCSSSNARAISFKLKWEIIVREHQYRSQSDKLLELYEGVFLG
jgi:hypothetical protein